MPTMKTTKCDICGHDKARVLKVSRTYGSGADLLVVEKVPVISCPKCGESYLTSKTLRDLEQLKINRKSLAVGRSVDVLTFK